MRELTARELSSEMAVGTDLVLLDVREDEEVVVSKLQQAVHIPMRQVPYRLEDLDSDRMTVVICRSGVRSLQIAEFLESKGFKSVWNLKGGMQAWAKDVEPKMTVA